ncbi:hypothetical protein BDV06DRAFT_136838 [Aspergillus oleicola]
MVHIRGCEAANFSWGLGCLSWLLLAVGKWADGQLSTIWVMRSGFQFLRESRVCLLTFFVDWLVSRSLVFTALCSICNPGKRERLIFVEGPRGTDNVMIQVLCNFNEMRYISAIVRSANVNSPRDWVVYRVQCDNIYLGQPARS